MPTVGDRDARNARRRELRHLREDAQRSHLLDPTAPSIPHIMFRRRGRRPRRVSSPGQNDLRNARRRELRRLQRTTDTSTQGAREEAVALQQRLEGEPFNGSVHVHHAIHLLQDDTPTEIANRAPARSHTVVLCGLQERHFSEVQQQQPVNEPRHGSDGGISLFVLR